MGSAAVEFSRVSKRFRLGAAHDSLAEMIAGGARRVIRGLGFRSASATGDGDCAPAQSAPGCLPAAGADRADEFWAIRDLDFSLAAGDALGIVGPNGAGKSTALKLISGILRPDGGTISVHGRLASLIEVGAGFHGDLTGRENIYLNGAILGMRKPEIRAKLDRIVAFAGLDRFIDTPVKRYSSGMYARLGFSIAAHVDPDVLLVDEVLSVGDAIFRLRCEERMRQLVSAGTTLVFVTHNLEQMQSICHRAIVLESGRCSFDGHPREAVSQYMTAQSRVAVALPTDVNRGRGDQVGDDLATLSFLNSQGEAVVWTRSRQSLTLVLQHAAKSAHDTLAYEVAGRAAEGENVVCFNSARAGQTFSCGRGDNRVSLSIPSLPLAGGRYFWNVRIWDTQTGTSLVNTPFQFPLIIDDEGQGTGLLSLDHDWSVGPVTSKSRSAVGAALESSILDPETHPVDGPKEESRS